MEYIILFVVLWLLFNVYLVRCMIDDNKRLKKFKESLHTEYGKPSQKKYPQERLKTIAGHFRKHDADFFLDDITWNDLDMDRVFQSMDYTFSAAGEEALYTLLRCPCQSEEELQKRERLISYFQTHEDDRVRLQLFFAQIGRTGKYSIYDYIDFLSTMETRSNKKHYAMMWFMLAAILLCFYSVGGGLCLLGALLVMNMATYFKEKKEIDPYITTFAYFIRILKVEQELSGCDIEILKDMTEEMDSCRRKFRKFCRGSFLLMHQNTMSGNPLDVFVDYLRMALHLNLIKFNTMLKEAKAYQSDILRIIELLGYVESMISIGAYRESLSYYTIPCFAATQGAALRAQELYHPLIAEPVANSVTLHRGMLLTGSNASGKSTFLKTVAIAQIMAQTIYTVPAKAYETDFYRLYTSMALRDDLAANDSYFIVEIKSLKRIIDHVDRDKTPVMCFVDEVLRGTNTVERIAASTEILDSLQKGGTLSFAATHDIELTTLLADSYENYHFEEKIEENDVKFNYQLCKGKATSRNAIRLLGVLGYEEEIIKQAERRAENFIKDGEWKK